VLGPACHTSAVVKIVLSEVGTEMVDQWYEQADLVVSSVITYAEACTALGRNDRLRGPDPEGLSRQVAELDARWQEFLVLPVAEHAAGRIVLVHGPLT
jgi:uncharacterized protein with PIN domain